MGYSFAPEPPEKIYGKSALSTIIDEYQFDGSDQFDEEKGTMVDYMQFAYRLCSKYKSSGFKFWADCFEWLYVYARHIAYYSPKLLAKPAIEFIPIDESRKSEWLSENNPEAIAAAYLKTLKP